MDIKASPTRIRAAAPADLPGINAVIEAAVMTWDLPDRVKRLSLPSYRYDELDFQHLTMVVAEDGAGRIVGVASWEPAEARDCPPGKAALLLHGLYVDPSAQRCGVGGTLLDAAADATRTAHVDGLLVKAQADAVGFFTAHGLTELAVEDTARHYQHRYWLALGTD